MGTVITLDLGNIEIDWGKNEFFNSHRNLFLETDVKDDPYDSPVDGEPQRKAYVKTLGELIPTLELLGYSLENCKIIFDRSQSEFDKDDEHRKLARDFTFDLYKQILSTVNVKNIKSVEMGGFDKIKFPEYYSFAFLLDPEFNKVYPLGAAIAEDFSGDLLRAIDPYVNLRLYAENPENRKMPVAWRYHELVENGWATEDRIHSPQLEPRTKYLLVTEGSSDLFVIRKSIELLRPEISRFFTFVDMEENYPFTGTGNMYRFCQGLVSIGIQNQILVIFDNDLEGSKMCQQTKALNLPRNLRVMKLPSMDEFKLFPTVGPSSESLEDVNGRAVAIEMFLDLKFESQVAPRVRWKSFDEKHQDYQGALEDKEKFVRIFKKVSRETEGYDFSKLEKLLDHLYKECLEINRTDLPN